MIILGVDPGVAATGFGVIAVDGGRMRPLEFGVIATSASQPLGLRLADIHRRIAELIDRHRPDALALEDLFVGGNPRTILSVGHARGAVLSACGLAGIDSAGYPPAEVKSTVCGFGRADKAQVERMVRAILGVAEPRVSDHATDALAVAVCHAHVARAQRALSGAAG
jgi:crossover junction endodeoxyribonuclease RuvC